jgi:hypothetical protein
LNLILCLSKDEVLRTGTVPKLPFGARARDGDLAVRGSRHRDSAAQVGHRAGPTRRLDQRGGTTRATVTAAARTLRWIMGHSLFGGGRAFGGRLLAARCPGC